MHSNPIKFSIIIPTYNYAHTLSRAIDSVLNQTYPHFEIIVVDDGSTDKTSKVLEMYQPLPFFKAVFQKNLGVSAARNKGSTLAVGDYCLFLDADDALTLNALEIFAQNIKTHPDIPWIAGASFILSKNRAKKIRYLKNVSNNPVKNFVRYLKHVFSIPNGSVALSQKIYRQITFPENLRNCEDFVFCAQMLSQYRGVVLPSPILQIYKHSESLRNNLSNDLNTGTKLVSCLFRSERLPKNLRGKKYKKICLSLRLLDIFRNLYLAKRYHKAKRYYIRAVKCYFPAVFYFSYFRKFLKIFFFAFTINFFK